MIIMTWWDHSLPFSDLLCVLVCMSVRAWAGCVWLCPLCMSVFVFVCIQVRVCLRTCFYTARVWYHTTRVVDSVSLMNPAHRYCQQILASYFAGRGVLPRDVMHVCVVCVRACMCACLRVCVCHCYLLGVVQFDSNDENCNIWQLDRNGCCQPSQCYSSKVSMLYALNNFRALCVYGCKKNVYVLSWISLGTF